ncbi:hypothetical protein L195_g040725 [Trifolium pratense]|uniref:Uncharacterized protein n=2 Tax=Trifolium pratense TaxID=57577 RepID=A0ACB0JKK9_TRIPR|nr:uncharacterized protein LOC123894857 [Trifolium pratense]PNX84662.1 hypothetical protein L195_g040725 [Trifolium pratense]CAJ2644168.1 unnamed protein product [Trifolium pratense]
MRNAKRNPLSDLTNSNHFSSSSVSSSATIHPIKNTPNKTSTIRRNHSPLSQTNFNLIDVKPSTLRCGKNQKKALALPTPLTVRCRKKQRVVSTEEVELQDFIQKQKAYYKEIDEFQLEEEEVESIDA